MQQEPRTASTLELVVNEQQLHNMSQIDLGPTANDHRPQQTSCQQQQQQAAGSPGGDFLGAIREWPAKVCQGFRAKLDEAQSKSENRTQYVLEVIRAFSGILVWALCLICTVIVPVILFIIGLFNLDNCVDRPGLPYLVFAVGFVMTTSNLFNLALAMDLPILTNHRLLSVDTKNTIASILNIMFNCIAAFLYILTSYMVYTVGINRAKPSERDENSGDGIAEEPLNCGGLLYYFTYWFVTLTLSLLAILVLIALSLFAYNRYRLAIIRGSTPRSQTNATTSGPNTNGTGSPFTSNNR